MNFERFGQKSKGANSEALATKEVVNGIENTEIEETSAVIFLSGKIDTKNYEDIQKKTFEILEKEGMKEFVFDMNNVSYVSSAGLRMFSAVNHKAAEKEVAYKLIKMRKDIMKLFELTGYASAFSIELKEED